MLHRALHKRARPVADYVMSPHCTIKGIEMRLLGAIGPLYRAVGGSRWLHSRLTVIVLAKSPSPRPSCGTAICSIVATRNFSGAVAESPRHEIEHQFGVRRDDDRRGDGGKPVSQRGAIANSVCTG